MQQREYSMHRNSHDSKRQQQEPDEGIEDQHSQRERPRKDQQEAPQQEGNHPAEKYDLLRRKVPAFFAPAEALRT